MKDKDMKKNKYLVKDRDMMKDRDRLFQKVGFQNCINHFSRCSQREDHLRCHAIKRQTKGSAPKLTNFEI